MLGLASPQVFSVPDLNKTGEEYKGHSAQYLLKDSFLDQHQECIQVHTYN